MSTQKKITSPFPFKSPYMTHEGHVSLKQNGTESKYSISLSDAFPHPTHFPEAQLCLQWEVPVCAGGNCVACVMGNEHRVG